MRHFLSSREFPGIIVYMELKTEKLKNSRVKFIIKADAADLAHAAEHAFAHVTSHTAVKGFRPGKAPKPLLVQNVGKGRILSELVDHALPELLVEASEKEKISIIEQPHYTLDKLCELKDDGSLADGTTLEFSAEADFAPDVTVGDYKKIKVKGAEPKAVSDKDVDETLERIADQRATYTEVKRAAKDGDRVELDFAGKRNGIPEGRLASKNYPLVIGSGTMIPGFEDEVKGKKADDTHTFEITFPADYHAKDLANQKVTFEVVIHKVEEKKLPDFDDAFAEDFGHKTIAELRDAIKTDIEMRNAQEAKGANESAVLDEFLKVVTVEAPQSLIERETDRQLESMRRQVMMSGMHFDHYLEHLKKTEEELREEFRPSAEKAVNIGLGLGEVVKAEGLDKEKDPGLAAIEKLVDIATGAPAVKKSA